MAREKGIVEAIEIATLTGRPLKIAAKIAPSGAEFEYYTDVFKPALEAAGSSVEFIGEVSGEERDKLFAKSYAALMPGSWPEPFGLAAIEALACGTPVLARKVGGLAEIIRDGVDGFFGDDVTELAFHVARSRGARSAGDPEVRDRALLGSEDGGRLRGALPADAWRRGRRGRPVGGRWQRDCGSSAGCRHGGAPLGSLAEGRLAPGRASNDLPSADDGLH